MNILFAVQRCSRRRIAAAANNIYGTSVSSPGGRNCQVAVARNIRWITGANELRAGSQAHHQQNSSTETWQEYTDPSTGNLYYYHIPTKTTQWERPAELGPEPSRSAGPAGGPRRTRKVPASPLERVIGFAALGADLAAGAVVEVARRGTGAVTAEGSAILSPRNAEVLAASLSRMRGAALKIGQMLSVQDESFLPAPIAEALKRVRTHADIMPTSQLNGTLEAALGAKWHDAFAHFGEVPVAAASIGQVHKAALPDGRAVAVKVQYPGVAQSINSDLGNLESLLSVLNVAPPGLFLDRIIDVAREELAEECDYTLEASYQSKFRELLADDERFAVPAVVPELSSGAILVSEWMDGVPIDDDSVVALPQSARNELAQTLLSLCLRELFEFRLVQTDPNWSNFQYQHGTGKLQLIDFGATRPLSQDFVAEYLELVWAAANQDRDELLKRSYNLGFLNGTESDAMVDAHVSAGFIAGEPFARDELFDFKKEAAGDNGMTKRMAAQASIFGSERRAPPPREIYALHRKLSGAIVTCTKLGVKINCREQLAAVYDAQARLQTDIN